MLYNKRCKIILFPVVLLIGLFVWNINPMVVHAVSIDEGNFPDANFRAVLSGPDYDMNGDGVLDDGEISQITNIYCEECGISSLQGVGYFYALQGLWCRDNAIGALDVSGNKALHGLWCSGNPLTSLDLSGNPELEWVYCYDCNLTSLNISNNPKMAYVECNTNPLASLDVSHNPLLEHLTCGSCELTSLNLSNNPNLSHLDAFANHLTSLDVTHNPKMKRLDIWNNPGLGSIDVSKCPGLQYYNCAYNDAGSVDVSNNPELQKLICSYNHISSLDLSNNPKLFYLDCACNQIGSLNLKDNPNLYFLQAFTNPFKTLDVSGNPALVKVYNEGSKQSESAVCKGHSWTIDYGGETSTGDDNILFLCFDDAATIITESDAEPVKEENKEKPKVTSQTEQDDLMLRQTVVWTLYNMAGCPESSLTESRFTDVKKGAWYEEALLWGEENAICVGYPNVYDDEFGVGEVITRQDLLFMLMRYSEVKKYKRAIDFGRSDEYTDYFEIDQYAWEAVTWSATWHIMETMNDNGKEKIDPKGYVTRADMEKTINRMLQANGKSSISEFDIPDIPEEEFAVEEEEVIEEVTETEPEEITEAETETEIEEVEEPEETPEQEESPAKTFNPMLIVIPMIMVGIIALLAVIMWIKRRKKSDGVV